MNEIVNMFLLVGNKSMPEMHLNQPGFTCGPLTKNRETIEKIMQTGNTDVVKDLNVKEYNLMSTTNKKGI